MQIMRVLAIDPASRCGWAHSCGPCGVWNLGSGAARLQALDWAISDVLRKWPADVIAYESASFGSHNPHVKSRHNELAGVIQLVALREQVQCWAFNPMQWKKIALTKGNLDKSGVQRMLKIIYGIEIVDDDLADAVGILKAALTGPPPPTKRQQRSAERKRAKKEKRLF